MKLTYATPPVLRDEFYSLSNGGVLAHMQMNGDELSQIMVTRGASEGIDNRVYTRILRNDAVSLSPEQYAQRRAIMRGAPQIQMA